MIRLLGLVMETGCDKMINGFLDQRALGVKKRNTPMGGQEVSRQPPDVGPGSGVERFVAPQDTTFGTAMAELRAGRKDSHWMWWIFPQLRALGRSPTAKAYGITDLREAEAYLRHPVLGPRLVEAARAMLSHRGRDPAAILGGVDALKLRSCATLFAAVPGADPVFRELLEAFYGGEADPLTLEAL
jgi:uncharacterized protein (DUF1810 family)